MRASTATYDCQFKRAESSTARERGVFWVILLTFGMMVVEIAVGYLGHSMALLADGWHMATHVGALGITAAAYAAARRYATHRAFAFGTGKVHALAGFTSAILLSVVAISMLFESLLRLLNPAAIDFGQSLPVAVVGLFVNLASVALLRQHDEHEPAAHASHVHLDQADHDHAHQAAFLHVLADAFTSALAILALLCARKFGVMWLDPATGIVGGIVILKWAVGLTRTTSAELLDVGIGGKTEDQVLCLISSLGDAAVLDLHVWSMGRGRLSCIVAIASESSRTAEEYRAMILDLIPFSHLTVEVRATRDSMRILQQPREI
jgi:cation diffusion facilitator family transporter